MSESGRRILNIIIAIVVSIGAWTYVVYNNDPMTEVRYKDIPITFTGEDALANNGLGISQASADTIDVTLRQRRVDTKDITAEDIDVVADVSSAVEGENGISLQISGPDGTQVSEADRHSISVEVEEADTVQKKIFVDYNGSLAGLEPVTTSLTSSLATVIGAKSEVERVDKVAALIEFDDIGDRAKKFTSSLHALDKDGDIIEHLVIYPGEVNFIAYSGVTKEVTLDVVTEEQTEDTGKDKSGSQTDSDETDQEENQGDGYTRTYTAPERIVIKGSAEALEGVSKISTELVDINSMYEDQEVELTLVLPEGVQIANASQLTPLVMKVKVTQNKHGS